MKPNESAKFTKTSTVNLGSGIPLKGTIISAVREHSDGQTLRPCDEILPNDRHEALYSDSLKYRSKYNPAYYVLDGKAFCVPIPSGSNAFRLTQTSFPTIFYNSIDIQDFPEEYEYLVMLYGAAKILLSKLGTVQDDLPVDVVIPSIPTSPILEFASFDVSTQQDYLSGSNLNTNLLFGDVDFSVLGVTATEPVFNKPIFVAPSFPSIQSLVIPVPDIFSDIPNFTTPAVASATITSQVPPVYNSPTISGVTELTGLEQLASDGEIDVYSESNDFGKWFSTLGHLIEDEEDMELASAQIQKINSYIGAYTAQVQGNFNKFQEQVTVYQNEMQAAIQQAQINAQEAQLESNLLLQKENQEYTAQLQSHSAKINRYQAEVASEVQKWQADEYGVKFNRWQQDYSGALQQYNVDLQAETGRVTNNFQIWKADVDAGLSKFTAETNADTQAFQSNVQALQANIGNFTSNLQRYTIQTQKLSAQNGENIQKFGADIQNYTSAFSASLQNYQSKIEKQKTKYQWLFGQYQSIMAEYNGAFGLQVQNRQKEQGGQ